jgi:hypothetical protein
MLSVAPDSFEEFFCGLKGAPLSLSKFEFRWHKLTTKGLGENGSSKTAVCLLLRQAFAWMLNPEYDESTATPKGILL